MEHILFIVFSTHIFRLRKLKAFRQAGFFTFRERHFLVPCHHKHRPMYWYAPVGVKDTARCCPHLWRQRSPFQRPSSTPSWKTRQTRPARFGNISDYDGLTLEPRVRYRTENNNLHVVNMAPWGSAPDCTYSARVTFGAEQIRYTIAQATAQPLDVGAEDAYGVFGCCRGRGRGLKWRPAPRSRADYLDQRHNRCRRIANVTLFLPIPKGSRVCRRAVHR